MYVRATLKEAPLNQVFIGLTGKRLSYKSYGTGLVIVKARWFGYEKTDCSNIGHGAGRGGRPAGCGAGTQLELRTSRLFAKL